MFCSNCGKPLNKEDKFCKSCGFPNRDYQENNNSNNNLRFNSLNENPSNNQDNFNMNNSIPNNQIINNQIPNNSIPNNQNLEGKNEIQEETPSNNIPIQSTNNTKNTNDNLFERILHGENKKLYMIIGVLSFVALICIILVIVNMVNKLNSNTDTPNQSSDKVETIDLSGTTYQVPSGYKIVDFSNNIYTLKGTDFVFSISISSGDYNNYKTNLNYFVAQVVRLKENQGYQYAGVETSTIGGREYIIMQFSHDSKIELFYITSANYAGYIYSGSTANYKFTYDKNDFLDISTMLANPSTSFSSPNIEVGDLELDFDLPEFSES